MGRYSDERGPVGVVGGGTAREAGAASQTPIPGPRAELEAKRKRLQKKLLALDVKKGKAQMDMANQMFLDAGSNPYALESAKNYSVGVMKMYEATAKRAQSERNNFAIASREKENDIRDTAAQSERDDRIHGMRMTELEQGHKYGAADISQRGEEDRKTLVERQRLGLGREAAGGFTNAQRNAIKTKSDAEFDDQFQEFEPTKGMKQEEIDKLQSKRADALLEVLKFTGDKTEKDVADIKAGLKDGTININDLVEQEGPRAKELAYNKKLKDAEAGLLDTGETDYSSRGAAPEAPQELQALMAQKEEATGYIAKYEELMQAYDESKDPRYLEAAEKLEEAIRAAGIEPAQRSAGKYSAPGPRRWQKRYNTNKLDKRIDSQTKKHQREKLLKGAE